MSPKRHYGRIIVKVNVSDDKIVEAEILIEKKKTIVSGRSDRNVYV